GRSSLKRTASEAPARRQGETPVVALELVRHGVVILGRRHGTDEEEILRRCPDHRRATDIDVFNGHGVRHIRSGRSFLERIQVGHYQIDWIDGQLLQSLHILRIISPRQKSAVNIWMERLHASAEYLRKSGQ